MLWHRQAIFESKEDKLSSFAEYRIRTQGLKHLIASRLNACWQTDWAIEDQAKKNLNSTARPYDQRAFSPLDHTADWLSHLALAKYMFVVVAYKIQSHTSKYTRGHTHTHAHIQTLTKMKYISIPKKYRLEYSRFGAWYSYHQDYYTIHGNNK